MFKQKRITEEEKLKVLREAVRLCKVGKYWRAVELYQRYGITDGEFSRALVTYMHMEDK